MDRAIRIYTEREKGLNDNTGFFMWGLPTKLSFSYREFIFLNCASIYDLVMVVLVLVSKKDTSSG